MYAFYEYVRFGICSCITPTFCSLRPMHSTFIRIRLAIRGVNIYKITQQCARYWRPMLEMSECENSFRFFAVFAVSAISSVSIERTLRKRPPTSQRRRYVGRRMAMWERGAWIYMLFTIVDVFLHTLLNEHHSKHSVCILYNRYTIWLRSATPEKCVTRWMTTTRLQKVILYE